MGRHAKNNTNASAFTWAERQMTGTGTKKALLGRDSFKDFDACSLCLSRATDPRICTSGHVFCHECSLNSLLSQKKDIKRQTLLLDKMRVENEAEMSEQRAAARERVLKEFDSAQGALGVAKGEKGKERSSTGKEGETGLVGPRGTKRAFELDEEEIERLTKEATDEALRRTAKEMAESRKAKLPNFWLPSLTPSATPESIINIKLQTLCHASVPPHPLSLKTLTPIKFTQENPDDKSASPVVICPSCRTTITNNVACWALKACGDVLCATCVDTLCRTDKACAHCSTKLDKKLPFIELKREGTGFAAGGGVSVSKYDLAFQAYIECPALTLLARGKVRDIYSIPNVDDALLFVATDRISSFDIITKNGIPNKGKLFNSLRGHGKKRERRNTAAKTNRSDTLDLNQRRFAALSPELPGVLAEKEEEVVRVAVGQSENRLELLQAVSTTPTSASYQNRRLDGCRAAPTPAAS